MLFSIGGFQLAESERLHPNISDMRMGATNIADIGGRR